MNADHNNATMYIVRNGYLICPTCLQNKWLMKIDPKARATRVIAYCRKCKSEHIVDIDKGACFQSQGQ